MARIAITGGAGQLGRQLNAAFTDAGHDVRAWASADLDITGPDDLERLTAEAPEIVINAAAWTDVDGCARDPERAMRINAEAAGAVAAAAARSGALIVQISTNEVFDGTLDRPYAEDDAPNPVNPYGASKLAGERAVAEANARHLIVRTAWLFGPGGRNFISKILAAAAHAEANGEALRVVDDEWGNPTWTRDLAMAIVGLVIDPPERRIHHLVGTPPATRLDWARHALAATPIAVVVEPVPMASFERASSPPPRAVLRPSENIPVLDWRPATTSYAAEVAASMGTHAG